MDAGLLDVLHDAADVQVLAVEEGVDVDLDGVLEEAVHQHRVVLGDLRGVGDVAGEVGLVVHDLHAAAAEHVARADQDRVADLVGDALGLLEGDGGAVLRGDQAAGIQHALEGAAVLGQVDGLRGGAQDRHAGVGEFLRELQRGLAAELHEHAEHPAGGFLRVDDLQHVLERQRLEVQAGGDVVVGGDGFRVAVDHDGLVAGLAQRHGGVHAGVVELDALADAVRARAQDDDRGLLVQRDLGLLVVGGVVVRGEGLELGGAGVDGLEDRADVQRVADAAHHRLGLVGELGDLRVGEAVALGGAQDVLGEVRVGADHLGGLVDQRELVEVPGVDAGLRRRCARSWRRPAGRAARWTGGRSSP